jgi:Caspase domain
MKNQWPALFRFCATRSKIAWHQVAAGGANRSSSQHCSGLRPLVFVLVLGFAMALFSPAGALPDAQLKATVLPAKAQVGDTKRLALVIGNGAYRNVSTLRNPFNDAAAVTAELQKLGYEVYLCRDLDRQDMNAIINAFLSQVQPGNEVLIYYAGHGVELQGSNYLLPVDIPRFGPGQDRLLRSEAINLTELLLDLNAQSARVSVVILDACRNNPFEPAGGIRGIGAKRGLGRVDPPQGIFVIFSAGVGEEALDNIGANDSDSNSLFTRKLLELMPLEGIELRNMVHQLRAEVRQAALNVGGNQVPSYYDQLLGDFFFKPRVPTEQTACDLLVKAEASQSAVLSADLDSGLQACSNAVSEFLAEPRFVHLLSRVQEQKAFQRALRSDDLGVSEVYLALFPTGRFIADVRTHLAALAERAKATKREAARAQLDVAVAKAEAAEAEIAKAEAAKAEAARAEARAEALKAEREKAEAQAAKAQAKAAQEDVARARAALAEAALAETAKAAAAKAEAEKAIAAAEAARVEAARAEAAKIAALSDLQRAKAMAETAKAQASALGQPSASDVKVEPMVAATPSVPEPSASPSASAPSIDPTEIASLLQVHLKRVGCDPGSVDGNWDAPSQRALGLFNRHSGSHFDTRTATLDALSAVRAKTARVCPLTCGRGYRVDGDHCVHITCSSGFVLNSSGECEKRKEPPKQTAHREQPRHEPATVTPRADGKCFVFNGKQFCA